MTVLLEFISGLLDGFGLIALALAIGGITYLLIVLRPTDNLPPILRRATDVSILVIIAASGSVALLRLLQLILKPLALADAMGEGTFAAFSKTQVFQVGLLSVLLALALTIAVLWLRHGIAIRSRWTLVVLTILLFMVNEAWLSHAASRIEGGGPLMGVTVVHMLGAVVWAGGITHLLLFWRLTYRDPDATEHWPALVSRFSPLGLTSVAFIIGPGLYLAWSYVGTWAGLAGTGYGNMLVVKVALFLFVLVLAALNFLAARHWRRTGDRLTLFERVPAYIEVELVLAGALLFTAAALTSFPPTVDVSQDAATPREMWSMFAPKVPRLNGPEQVMIEAPEFTDLRTGKVGYKPDTRWDRFNHNVSGVIVLLMGCLALLDRMRVVSWARHWPLTFLAFSILILVFANPDHWPLGSVGFLESLLSIEVVQHWLAALVVCGLGVFEWRARHKSMAGTNLPFVFPMLCIAGGIVLLTHSHEIVELKREFLIQSTHVAMGLLSVLIGCARWLELRLTPPHDRTPAFAWVGGIMLVGLILLFYITPELG